MLFFIFVQLPFIIIVVVSVDLFVFISLLKSNLPVYLSSLKESSKFSASLNLFFKENSLSLITVFALLAVIFISDPLKLRVAINVFISLTKLRLMSVDIL